MSTIEAIAVGVLIPFAVAVVVLVWIFAWEWLRDQVHPRRYRSSRDRVADNLGAAVATSRWALSLWVRGGWRVVVCRDTRNDGMEWSRFLRVSNAISNADADVRRQYEEAD